jgi:hypothetical protein
VRENLERALHGWKFSMRVGDERIAIAMASQQAVLDL